MRNIHKEINLIKRKVACKNQKFRSACTDVQAYQSFAVQIKIYPRSLKFKLIFQIVLLHSALQLVPVLGSHVSKDSFSLGKTNIFSKVRLHLTKF